MHSSMGANVPIRRKDQPKEPLQQLLLGHIQVRHAVVRKESRPRCRLGHTMERTHVPQPVLVHRTGRRADIVHCDAPVQRVNGLPEAVVEQVLLLDEVQAPLDRDGAVINPPQRRHCRGADAHYEGAKGAVGVGLAGFEAVQEATPVEDGCQSVDFLEPVVEHPLDEVFGGEEGETVAVMGSRGGVGTRRACDDGAQVCC